MAASDYCLIAFQTDIFCSGGWVVSGCWVSGGAVSMRESQFVFSRFVQAIMPSGQVFGGDRLLLL